MNTELEKKFSTYPELAKEKLAFIRSLIFDVAKTNDLGQVDESLKWNEPSYTVRGGSPVRFDWKSAKPDQYAIYFNCNTKLVDTFRVLYGDVFNFEGNRAMVFGINDAVPRKPLEHCLSLALRYHSVKSLPLLGG